MKDKKFIYGSVLTVAFLLTVGLTYAYFSQTVSGNDVAETIDVGTTKLELKYTDGNQIIAGNIEPGWTTTKTITVENKGNEETYYSLGWQKLYNEIQKNELMIRCVCGSSGVDNGSCDNGSTVIVPQVTTEAIANKGEVLYPYKESQKILPGETHTYTVSIRFVNYTDKAQNYNQGKRFYGVLGVAESIQTATLAQTLIDNYKNLDLISITHEATGNQKYSTTEYRFQGKDPNNYITFNGEEGLWRIVGLFEVETPQSDGTYKKENKVKIVRDSIGQAAWDFSSASGSVSDWTKASLMTLLNEGAYFNRQYGYSPLGCSIYFHPYEDSNPLCDYTTTGLTDEARSQISTTKWYLGNQVYSSGGYGTAESIYTRERSTDVWDGNSQTWDGKVGLLYPSDYMYASNVCYDGANSGNYKDDECVSTNWLMNNTVYWLLSPESIDQHAVLIAQSEGTLYINGVDSASDVDIRPTVYLNADVKFVSGNGKSTNPFIIK